MNGVLPARRIAHRLDVIVNIGDQQPDPGLSTCTIFETVFKGELGLGKVTSNT